MTESALNARAGCLDWAVVGIGVNVCPPAGGFPPELDGVAGAVFDAPLPDAKNRLAAAVLGHLWACYTGAPYAAEYRRRSLVVGRQIRVISSAGQRSALALDVDDDCRLLVQYPDGRREALSTGEISIRLAPDPG